MTVTITPMPASARDKRFRPLHPPIFPDGAPTPDEIELALALFAELDSESQSWYGGAAFIAGLRAKLPK